VPPLRRLCDPQSGAAHIAELGAVPETTVLVSGIGCSSRFPCYVERCGFHTIHGRAPAVATGMKLANPDLDIWIVTGDGLSIGGSHVLHALRRNLDGQILLFSNEIRSLTSRVGTKTPSTPHGSVDTPARRGSRWGRGAVRGARL
jgi:2-oxoglutarate ferredoxin oxidoreductase subunit beta